MNKNSRMTYNNKDCLVPPGNSTRDSSCHIVNIDNRLVFGHIGNDYTLHNMEVA